MPSIINRAGVVADFGEETGGDLPETTEALLEVKAVGGKVGGGVKAEDAEESLDGELPTTKL